MGGAAERMAMRIVKTLWEVHGETCLQIAVSRTAEEQGNNPAKKIPNSHQSTMAARRVFSQRKPTWPPLFLLKNQPKG